MPDVAKRVTVAGRVTGVGFRYSTVRKVSDYPDVEGYVRNADSRTVECVLQGPAEEVEEIIQWLHQGPSGARVQDVKVDTIAKQDFNQSFDVRY